MENKKIGFTFFELIAVLAIIGILAAIVIPNFRGRQPGFERKQFLSHLNALMQVAWQNAVVTHKIHKITFDLEKNLVSVDVQGNKKTATGENVYSPMATAHINSTYSWPENNFEFKNFYVNKRDELSLTLKGSQKGKVWFFIVPDGLAQPVIINLLDNKDIPVGQKEGTPISFVLNPFTAQFKEYDEFKKP